MNEKEFTQTLQRALQAEFIDYEVLTGENLLYKVIMNNKGEFEPKDLKKNKVRKFSISN